MINLNQLPPNIKIEITKAYLLAFAKYLLETNKSNSPPPPVSEILTLDEAADFLKLAKQTLYGMTSKSEIPFYKRQRKLYFKRTDLMKWLEEGKRDANSENEVDIYLRKKQK